MIDSKLIGPYPRKLASILNDNSIELGVNTASALGQLVHESTPIDDITSNSILRASKVSVHGEHLHDARELIALKQGSEQLRLLLDTSRNKVLPMRKEIVEGVEAHLTSNAQRLIPTTEIIRRQPPEATTLSALEDMVLPHSRHYPIEDSSLNGLLADAGAMDTLVSRATFGKPELDAAIEVPSHLNHMFPKSAHASKVSHIEDNLVFLKLLYTLRVEEPLDSRLSAGDYISTVNALFANVARKVRAWIEHQGELDRANTLVVPGSVSVNGHSIRVSVYDACYSRFLANGGSPEILLGGIALNPSIMALTYHGLLKNSEACLKAEARLGRQETEFTATEELSQIRAGITKTVRGLITEMGENDTLPGTHTVHTLNAIFRDWRAANVFPIGGDLIAYCTRLVCDVFYPQRNYREVIDNIDARIKRDPTLDPREAATLAAVDVTVDWLMSQVSVHKD